ncbi:MAG TPA: hypothetical protein VK676_12060 [Steroidobacteraceae bacterium]|jgi:hypothetical protein|nr:hypothetical protein [Steroidobacteraceae bacterium]
MSDAFSRAGPFFLVLVLGAAVLALAYRQSKRRASTDGQSRSWLDYLLLWPLLFEKSSSVDRSRRLLTNREIAGWLFVVLFMIAAWVFF